LQTARIRGTWRVLAPIVRSLVGQTARFATGDGIGRVKALN
jgi:hypothetical protein